MPLPIDIFFDIFFYVMGGIVTWFFSVEHCNVKRKMLFPIYMAFWPIIFVGIIIHIFVMVVRNTFETIDERNNE